MNGPFPKLVMEVNHTCLLLTPPLISWLVELLLLMKNSPFKPDQLNYKQEYTFTDYELLL